MSILNSLELSSWLFAVVLVILSVIPDPSGIIVAINMMLRGKAKKVRILLQDLNLNSAASQNKKSDVNATERVAVLSIDRMPRDESNA